MKYAFFRGCFIPVRLAHIEKVAMDVLPLLGVNLEPVPGFTCCPEPIGVGLNHRLTGLAVSARNLALAEEMDLDLITLCNGCTYTLKKANLELKTDDALREKVNNVLAGTGHEFRGSIDVKHFAEVLMDYVGLDKVRSVVEKPLTGLRVASHTGCHILSPPEVMGFDNPLDPVKLDVMMEALGASPLSYMHKTQCCGWTVSNFGERENASTLLWDKLNAMNRS